MPRIARTVVPGLAHHVTQRGNRRQRTFFTDSDYADYVGLMSESCERWEVEIWAWCLMPNHAHLIAVPASCDGLRRAIGEAHRRYTLMVNEREGWQGYLWQGRFRSFVMDERYTLAAARYVELNPVRAGLVTRAEDYPWSSARAHLAGRDDGLVRAAPLLERMDDWAAFLGAVGRPELAGELHEHVSTGHPLGSDEFVERLEREFDRPLRPGRPGPLPELASCPPKA
jgi:putative transposase